MDLRTYDKILRFKQQNSITSSTKHTDAFRWDLAKGKTIWTDNFCKDYGLYIQNNHLLFSIFFVSSLHPFSTVERILTLFTETCLAFSIFVLFESMKMTQLFHYWIIVFADATLISFVAFVIQMLGTCRNMPNDDDAKQKCYEFIRGVVILIITIIVIICVMSSTVVFIGHMDTNEPMELHACILAEILSWFIDLFINLLLFIADATSERKSIANAESNLKITYVDYLKWKDWLKRINTTKISNTRYITDSVEFGEIGEIESGRRRSSLYPILDGRDSINSTTSVNTVISKDTRISANSHYVIDAYNNVTEINKTPKVCERYENLKGKKLIIFAE
eukprot:317413_1